MVARSRAGEHEAAGHAALVLGQDVPAIASIATSIVAAGVVRNMIARRLICVTVDWRRIGSLRSS
jgi:hypothetical protein